MKEKNLAFGKQNYILIGISFALVVLGFILMAGGGTDVGTGFDPEIFSVRRIVIAPTVSLAGFVIMIYAILKDSKANKASAEKITK